MAEEYENYNDLRSPIKRKRRRIISLQKTLLQGVSLSSYIHFLRQESIKHMSVKCFNDQLKIKLERLKKLTESPIQIFTSLFDL
jgi:hypothetical protein